jgi:amino acid adenylation domain-containing protein
MEARATSAAQSVVTLLDVESSIPACFQRQARLHPARTALSSATGQFTYHDLDTAASRLAAVIQAYGGSPGDRVALLMRHDIPLVAAVLAVLKAARVVVVINPADPPARLEQVLEDAAPALILTEPAHHERAADLAGSARRMYCWEYPAGEPTDQHADDPLTPDDLAFLIYTSGSTGRPKGVMHTHRSILHNVYRLSRGFGLGPRDRVALPASLSGGHGVASACCALLSGAALYPFPIQERGVAGLADWLCEQGITVFTSSASVFRQFIKTLHEGERLPGLRLARLGSEPVSSDDLAAFRNHFPEGSVLLHTFSSSETGNMTQLRLTHADSVADGLLPLGEPAEGVTVQLLDEQGRQVPPGQTGEVIVRSRYFSPGYWRNDALSAERFAAAGEGGERAFRPGDLARRTVDGLLLYAGRKDARVKVHGFGVELLEVEGALRCLTGVTGAVVCARAQPDGDNRLVAYVTCRPDHTLSSATLRHALGLSLPGYMVPASFVLLDRFPLTAHGKIDREALARIQPPAPLRDEEPLTPTEALLADIWGEVLGRGPTGRHDDFFELGGDSLIATAAAARASGALGVELDLRLFADHPTPASLAAFIDNLRASGGENEPPPLVRVRRDGPLPLSFIQEQAWRHSQTPEGLAAFTHLSRHRLRGPLDVAALRDSLDNLVGRHEILRTTFYQIDGAPVQIIHPPAPLDLPVLDFSSASDAEERACRFLAGQACQPFDLGRLPLFRLWLVRIRSNEHWLLRLHHHIISDGWSWRVLFQELAPLYEARLRGEKLPMPRSEPLQYADFAAWERQSLRPESPAYRKTVAWWKDTLSGQPQPVELPFRARKPRPGAKADEGYLTWGVEPRTTAQLGQLGREMGANYLTLRLAAFVALLSAQPRQRDIVLGTYLTTRTRSELRDMFGFFANLAMLRFQCEPGASFRRWVDHVRSVLGPIQAHCGIPYPILCEELRRQGVTPPEVRALFSVADQTEPISLGNVEATWLQKREIIMPWGFTLQFNQHHEQQDCNVEFDARLHDPRGVRHWVGLFTRFLDRASRDPDESVVKLLARCEAPRGLFRRFFRPLAGLRRDRRG